MDKILTKWHYPLRVISVTHRLLLELISTLRHSYFELGCVLSYAQTIQLFYRLADERVAIV